MRNTAKETTQILAKIFHFSMKILKFPAQQKNANITMIHKKEDKSIPSNFRLVSLVSVVAKVMETHLTPSGIPAPNLHYMSAARTVQYHIT